jgi:CRISP-associated protein Cas1
LEGVGLDSYLGTLHQLDYGRQSLALDLVELFRAPLVDRLVLTILNRHQFDASDFEPREGGGLYLRPESCKRFLAEYERFMLHAMVGNAQGFRALLRQTVESYGHALGCPEPAAAFRPFLFAVADAVPENAVGGQP